MKFDKFDIVALLLILICAIFTYFYKSEDTETETESEVNTITVTDIDTVVAKLATIENEEIEKETIDPDLCTHAAPKKRNGHMCVDLGTSVLWATSNIGANEICTNEGDHFCFGETSVREGDYSYNEYKQNRRVNYDTLPNTRLMPQDDAARAIWGGQWRTPTDDEVNELRFECNYKWTKNYKNSGVEGCIISCKCKKNPKSIFLPVSGYMTNEGTVEHSSGIMGQKGVNLWTSTIKFNDTFKDRKSTYNLLIYNDIYSKDVYFNTLISNLPHNRMAIRPVIKKN